MNKNIAFILYDSRSGSTLLASLLNMYSSINVSLESAFVSRILEANENLLEQNSTQIVEFLSKEDQFKELGVNFEKLMKDIDSSLLDSKYKLISIVIDNLFLEMDSDNGLYIIKHPPYNYIGELIKEFPKVKFIHIIRDGRAVFNSKKKSKSIKGGTMESNTIMAALDWKWKINKTLLFKDNIITVRYEDLIQKTEEVLNKILDFFKVLPDNRVKTKSQNSYFSKIGNSQKKLHINVGKTLDPEILVKWKVELGENKIKLYNLLNKKTLVKYGYDLQVRTGFKTYLLLILDFIILIASKVFNLLKVLFLDINLFKEKLSYRTNLLKKR